MKYLQLNKTVKVSGGFTAVDPIVFIVGLRVNQTFTVPARQEGTSTQPLTNGNSIYIDLIYYKSIEDFLAGENSIMPLQSQSPFQVVDVDGNQINSSNMYELVAPKFEATVEEAQPLPAERPATES